MERNIMKKGFVQEVTNKNTEVVETINAVNKLKHVESVITTPGKRILVLNEDYWGHKATP